LELRIVRRRQLVIVLVLVLVLVLHLVLVLDLVLDLDLVLVLVSLILAMIATIDLTMFLIIIFIMFMQYLDFILDIERSTSYFISRSYSAHPKLARVSDSQIVGVVPRCYLSADTSYWPERVVARGCDLYRSVESF